MDKFQFTVSIYMERFQKKSTVSRKSGIMQMVAIITHISNMTSQANNNTNCVNRDTKQAKSKTKQLNSGKTRE
jgi:hypothetical protein